jgi:Cu2+-exporting ATPase
MLAVVGFAAMNVMLLSVSVWAGNVSDTDAGDARSVSLAVRLDRAAAAACRPAVFPKRLPALRAGTSTWTPISIGVTLALGLGL